MTDSSAATTVGTAHGLPAARPMIRAVRGLSDRAIAWWFILPSIFLLLAINIFPLLWTIYLSFTDYRANQPGREIKWIGLRNYERLLTSEDVWGYLQVTAHFVCWSIFFQVVLGLGLALLINRQFHSFWTTLILLPMMLSPAVVGVFWKYPFQPQAGIFNYIVNFFVLVLVNVDDPALLATLDPRNCDGVGLTRTEFLFQGSDLPDEETQLRAYAGVLR